MDLRPHGLPEAAGDKFTRVLHKLIPESWQQRFRDGGYARRLVDGLVTLSSVTMHEHALRFMHLGNCQQSFRYASHEQCVLHILDISSSLNDMHISDAMMSRNVLVFVHGGAWGSGKPWMYRLTAAGIGATLQARFVVLVEYPVYPNSTVLQQRDCVSHAMRFIKSHDWEKLFASPRDTTHSHLNSRSATDSAAAPLRVILSGHSSGANICALAMLHAAEHGLRLADAFVGLCGVYDIQAHYEFERARGVHVVSPMGAAAGPADRFWASSPTLLLQHWPVTVAGQCHAYAQFLPRCLLLHGTADTTVPFTSSQRFAQELQKLRVPVCTAYPAVDHIQPVFEFLTYEGSSSDSFAAGEQSLGPCVAALTQWYTSNMGCAPKAVQDKKIKTLSPQSAAAGDDQAVCIAEGDRLTKSKL